VPRGDRKGVARELQFLVGRRLHSGPLGAPATGMHYVPPTTHLISERRGTKKKGAYFDDDPTALEPLVGTWTADVSQVCGLREDKRAKDVVRE
jgi:hypothetical protein